MTVLAALFLLAGFSLSSCGAPLDPPHPIGQEDYLWRAENDRRQLIEGRVLYPASMAGEVGEPQDLVVHVCGLSAGCGHIGIDHSAPGSSVPGTTKVGARMLVRASSDMPGQITQTSSTVQPVLTAEDLAEWRWLVTPAKAGRFTLRIHLTALAADTDDALLPDLTLPISLRARVTVGRSLDLAWHRTLEAATGVGGVLSALGVSAATISLAIRRARRRQATMSRSREVRYTPRGPRNRDGRRRERDRQ